MQAPWTVLNPIIKSHLEAKPKQNVVLQPKQNEQAQQEVLNDLNNPIPKQPAKQEGSEHFPSAPESILWSPGSREENPTLGERLCSLSSNQSQFAAGGASGRCECKEQFEQAMSSQHALYQICVLWRLAQVPASSTLRGQCQDMTASATQQLWPCWEKRGRTNSAKKAAVHKGATAAQEFSIAPTRWERSTVTVTPVIFPHTTLQATGFRCPHGCHLPPNSQSPLCHTSLWALSPRN